MSLLFLSHEDFSIKTNNKGAKVLCHNISGYSLILFFSTKCEFCQTAISMFKRIVQSMDGCQFGLINVTSHPKTMEMCRVSGMVKYVPFIVLYFDGQPFMSYDGPQEDDKVCQFIIEVSKSMKNNQQFAKQGTNSQAKIEEATTEKPIPAYTIGVPLCGTGNVCYLLMESAYPAKK